MKKKDDDTSLATLFISLKEQGNNESSSEGALVYLYETLIDELGNPRACDYFIKQCIGTKLNTDVIVHILNSLSPIKDSLPSWDKFKKHCYETLEKEIGKQQAENLIQVVL